MNNFFEKLCLLFTSIFKNFFFKNKVFYLIDYFNWANFNDAINLKNYFKGSLTITRSHIGIKNSIIHVGTLYKLIKNNQFIKFDNSNKIIVFWPHLNKSLKVSYLIKKNISKIHKIHTCCKQTSLDLINFGIKKKKIVNIPLSINLNVFKPIKKREKIKLKKKYNIPVEKIVLGSFVKDGNGFDKGLTPKKIKNPQMLIKALKRVKDKRKLYFILSGPARGYVKNKLRKIGIEYFHKNCKNKKHLAELYNLTDLTIINSNLEGGPYSVLESLASGVPVISTKVGLSQELIKKNYNGFLINKMDSENLKKKIEFVIKNKKILKKLKNKARISVKKYSIDMMGKKISKSLYNLN
tara:strand:+ start:204 stop:1259 length:1056 start_codon:yes stop_codon:yes gene_type:complete